MNVGDKVQDSRTQRVGKVKQIFTGEEYVWVQWTDGTRSMIAKERLGVPSPQPSPVTTGEGVGAGVETGGNDGQ
ncbi:MAG: hypothetical protein M0Z43_00250 [Acidithiobacillus sp.]|nr:hypothetical protein [Acidithiobacillus sp.]